MRMIVLSLFAALALLVGIGPLDAGPVVSQAEARGIFGAACSGYVTPNRWYCFGGTCAKGGCGCAFAGTIGQGVFTVVYPATPCASSNQCTDIWQLTSTACGGGT